MNHPGERPAVHWPRASTRLAGRLFFRIGPLAGAPCCRVCVPNVGLWVQNWQNDITFNRKVFCVTILRKTTADSSRLSLCCAKLGRTALVCLGFAQNQAGQLSFAALLRKTWVDSSGLPLCCAKLGRTALVCCFVAQNLAGQLPFVAVFGKTGADCCC